MMTDITEKWPDMDPMPKWAQEAIPKGQLFHEAFKRIDTLREALSDIEGLAVNYDGFTTVNDMMSLVDDMANISKEALAERPWTVMIGVEEETWEK